MEAMMDNLIVLAVWGAPLTLFSVLYAAERLSARRYRRKVEARLMSLRVYPNPRLYPTWGHHSRTWPATRIRPYQRKAR